MGNRIHPLKRSLLDLKAILNHFRSPSHELTFKMTCGDIFLGLLAIIFPPLAVWVKRGICSADSLINILLCVLGYIPGLLHAWYIIARFPEEEYDYEHLPDSENRVTYYYVSHQPGQPRDYGTQGGQQGAEPGLSGWLELPINRELLTTYAQGRGIQHL